MPSEPAIHLLSDPQAEDGAAATFHAVLRGIREARESIEIHMFVWRNDDIGNEVGRVVLEAAERGVKVKIIKDLGAFMYERIEMNRKSFFNKAISKKQSLIYKLLTPTFPDTYCEDDYGDELGNQVINHPLVTMEWVNHTHTKYYIFDEEVMLTGSINLEDRHRGYFDYMIRIEGKAAIERLRQRQSLSVPFDSGRSMDFALNVIEGPKKTFEIKPEFLRLIGEAEKSIVIEMAYIGDPDISDALVASAKRGVKITMLFSREANIGNDINYHAMHELCQRAPIEAYLTPKMIHSKLMLVDEEIVMMGSANFSVFSMQKAEELNVVIRNHPEVLAEIRKTLKAREAASEKVEDVEVFSHYNHFVARLQQLHQKLNSWFN
ncbi:MAG: phosphatidylserine/phosphatidylglycerophosphate/cardiolipin synthase family protein [Akkermansiaceae bacterium]|nr:phosphatidylserine/phosphatidylglycerophosphate/cardiolipin synthase family protein [Akkermansiaceae bacterium]